MTLQQKFLEDGSFTLYEPELGEHYHNRVGAYTESLEQYTLLALEHWQRTNDLSIPAHVRLWDVCFGRGYNTFTFIHTVAIQQAQLGVKTISEITIQAVELDEQLQQLWPVVIGLEVYPLFKPGNGYTIEYTQNTIVFTPVQEVSTLPKAVIHVCLGDALKALPRWEALPERQPVHAIFHDAFSPRKVPHLWQESIFITYANVLCKQQGVLLTYSVARLVKNAIENAGLIWKKTEALHKLGHKKGGLMGYHLPV